MKFFLLAAILAPLAGAGLIFDIDPVALNLRNDSGLGFPPITFVAHYQNTGPNDLMRIEPPGGQPGTANPDNLAVSLISDLGIDLIAAMSTVNVISGGFTIDRLRAVSGTYRIIQTRAFQDVVTHELFIGSKTFTFDVIQTPEVNTFWTALGAAAAALLLRRRLYGG